MRRFEEEFVGLNNILLDMGGMVAQSVHRSVLALVERNADYAYQVMHDETVIDECDIRIDAMVAESHLPLLINRTSSILALIKQEVKLLR